MNIKVIKKIHVMTHDPFQSTTTHKTEVEVFAF